MGVETATIIVWALGLFACGYWLGESGKTSSLVRKMTADAQRRLSPLNWLPTRKPARLQ